MLDLFKQDIQEFANSFELADSISNSTFLITGSTGLIGSSLVKCLLILHKNIKIVCPVRNLTKAFDMFSKQECDNIEFVECDLSSFDFNTLGCVDYIIHCAAPTSSKFFVERPVDTFTSILNITHNLLTYANNSRVKAFVYVSSVEVYGAIHDDSLTVTEDVQGYIDPMAVRSSYSMAKRAAENLCAVYASQYKLPVMVARLTQTTGANISPNDNRYVAQFCRLAAIGDDIILFSTGMSAKPICYTMDSVSAILYIMLKGETGSAYNVANEDTYISVKGLAEYLRDHFNPSITVKVEINEKMGYAPETKLRICTDKLKALGWTPKYNLHSILSRIISIYKK